MKWVIAFTIVISAGIMGFIYVNLSKNAPPQQVAVSTATSTRSLSMYHAFKDGEHRFSGQVKLPHSCYALDAQALHDKKNPNIVTINLIAADKMLDQALCAKIPTNYPFQILAEGPEDIEVRAEFNGEELGVKMTDTEWQSSVGTYINPVNQ
jgi:hypothetical protein